MEAIQKLFASVAASVSYVVADLEDIQNEPTDGTATRRYAPGAGNVSTSANAAEADALAGQERARQQDGTDRAWVASRDANTAPEQRRLEAQHATSTATLEQRREGSVAEGRRLPGHPAVYRRSGDSSQSAAVARSVASLKVIVNELNTLATCTSYDHLLATSLQATPKVKSANG